jgi:hypothetical protein
MTLAGGETTPERENRGDDVSWADINLTRLKNNKNHHVDSTVINEQ